MCECGCGGDVVRVGKWRGVWCGVGVLWFGVGLVWVQGFKVSRFQGFIELLAPGG